MPEVRVVGPGEGHLAALRRLESAGAMRVRPLLRQDDVKGRGRYVIADLLAAAHAQLRAEGAVVDGVAAFWDFPATSLAASLAADLGTPGPPLEAVVACEHKHWSRRLQREVTDAVPAFAVVDLFEPGAAERVDVPLPAWVKPVKSYASQLAYRVASREDLSRALAEIREGIARFAEPVDELLARVDAPPAVRRLGGWACLVEAEVTGRQVTVEGHVLGDGRPRVHGVVDAIRTPDGLAFERYQYPSTLPPALRSRMADLAARVVAAHGLRWSGFNVELFWDQAADRLWVLEVNPRVSQSHSALLERVDGRSNLRVMADVALGREPRTPAGQGPDGCAAKCFVRRGRADGHVTAAPSPADLAAVEARLPGVRVEPLVRVGTRLSELRDQDPYGWTVAHLYIGAEDPDDLLAKRDAALAQLDGLLWIEAPPLPAGAPPT